MHDYTRRCIETMARAGAPVDMVQVGNEITAGMLWPLGQVYATDTPDWDGLRHPAEGRRRRRPRGAGTPPAGVMVHIDRGGDNGGARWFYDHVLERGVEFDEIGLSYYPFWHGPIDDLQANLVDLAGAYGKPLTVVEASYPWTLENGDDLENHIDVASELPDAERWPATPAGQADYFRALREVFAQVPDGLGRGFFTWEPEWVPGRRLDAGRGQPERQPDPVRLRRPGAARHWTSRTHPAAADPVADRAYAAGATPSSRRKCRVRWAWSWKPTACATSAARSPVRRSRRARSSRRPVR